MGRVVCSDEAMDGSANVNTGSLLGTLICGLGENGKKTSERELNREKRTMVTWRLEDCARREVERGCRDWIQRLK